MRQQSAPLLSAREATAELRHGAEVRAQQTQPGLAAVHHLRAPLLFGALIVYGSSASLGSTSKRSRGSTYSSGSALSLRGRISARNSGDVVEFAPKNAEFRAVASLHAVP